MHKRKAFNFFRSYWETAQKLSEEDRLKFYDALMKKQFLNEDSELSGLADLVYTSQKHSIDSQVNGYLTKTKAIETQEHNTPTEAPYQGGSKAPDEAPYLQVQEKEKEQVEVKVKEESSKSDRFASPLMEKRKIESETPFEQNGNLKPSTPKEQKEKSTPSSARPPKKEKDQQFELFWNHYHEVTGRNKTDKEPAEKYWKRIKSIEERRKAYTMVKPFFKSLKEDKGSNFIHKARTYLSDKLYNNEFKEEKKTVRKYNPSFEELYN